MATPSRRDRMVQNFMTSQNHAKKEEHKCGKQFPDCPEVPNEKDCKGCPFWKK